jgi:hypothetical protein
MTTFWIVQSLFAVVLAIFICGAVSCWLEARRKRRDEPPRVVEPIPGSFDQAICARCGYEIKRYETRMMSHAHRLYLCEACSIDAPSCVCVCGEEEYKGCPLYRYTQDVPVIGSGGDKHGKI